MNCSGQKSAASGQCLGGRKPSRVGSVLEQREKSNEITAIPLLLEQLALGGCIVTIDAMRTQTKIAEQIIDQAGDYALALKDNHGNLFDEVKATFALAEKDGFLSPYWEADRQVEKGHGQLEIREQWTLSDPEILAYLDPEHQWKGLRGIGIVRAERRMEQKTTKETRYFLLSFSSVKTFATAVRSHWGIENSLACIGSSISLFGRMNRALGSVMLTKISRCSAISA